MNISKQTADKHYSDWYLVRSRSAEEFTWVQKECAELVKNKTAAFIQSHRVALIKFHDKFVELMAKQQIWQRDNSSYTRGLFGLRKGKVRRGTIKGR